MSLFTLLVRHVFSPHANERIKIYYRRNLEMSAGKLAAQCVHAALALPKASPLQSVVVLSLSDVKFQAADLMALQKTAINMAEMAKRAKNGQADGDCCKFLNTAVDSLKTTERTAMPASGY